jgi:hypothetical protein
MATGKRRRAIKARVGLKTRSKLTPKVAVRHRRRAHSKQEGVLTMLRRPGGASIAAIMQSTGWQPHSVRGFFAGVVRKRLGLKLESAKADGERVYRIAAEKPPTAEAAPACEPRT